MYVPKENFIKMLELVKSSRIPTKWYNNVLKSLDSVESSSRLFDITNDIKNQFGFTSIAYGLVTPNNFRSENYYISSDKSKEWKQTYIDKEYWKIDTRIIVARQQSTPFLWSELPNRSDFISNDIMMGIWDGMTVPVHGPKNSFGFLNFTFDPRQKKISSWLQYIQPHLIYLAQRIIEAESALIKEKLLSSSQLINNFPQNIPAVLTLQQRKCLTWAAEGKTTEEIALILNNSVSTVNKHLDSASVALNTNSRTHAIAKAVDGNLIALMYKKKSNIFYI